MSIYSDPVNISIGCTMVLSGFPVYYLVIQRKMSNRCHRLLCKYALGLGFSILDLSMLWGRVVACEHTNNPA